MHCEPVSDNDSYVHVALHGSLDTVGVEEIGLPFTTATVTGGKHALVDLSGVDYVSSLGMALLIRVARAFRAKGRTVVFFALQPAVFEALKGAHLTPVLTIAPDVEAARAMLDGTT